MVLSRMPRRSANKARNLILDMARHGEHRHNIPPTASTSSLDRWFSENGHPFSTLVQQLRDPAVPVPFVENLLGPNWTSVGDGGGTWSVVDGETGQELSTLTGPGVQSTLTYHSQFDQAVQTLERAISNNSYQELQQAIATGVASIDTFVSDRVRKWNALHPNNELIDVPPYKTFDSKIGDWFPIMVGGKRYDKSGKDWDAFKRLRDLRDNEAIHTKTFAQAISFVQLAEWCNLFTQGITQTMFDMHLFFGLRVPSSIIRAKYLPDVTITAQPTPPPS